LRAAEKAGRTITVRVRFADLTAVTRSTTLADPTAASRTVAAAAETLVRAALADHPDERVVSLLGISVSGLVDEHALQLALPLDGTTDRQAESTKHVLDEAMDQIRERYGKSAVTFLRTAGRSNRGIDDEFRELAERDLQ
jgi:DNA polymerase IV